MFVPCDHYGPHPGANLLKYRVVDSSHSLLLLPLSRPLSSMICPVAGLMVSPSNNFCVVLWWCYGWRIGLEVWWRTLTANEYFVYCTGAVFLNSLGRIVGGVICVAALWG